MPYTEIVGITIKEVIAATVATSCIAAVLFPAFSQRKGDAADPCFSSLRQVMLGAIMYATDWDDVLSPARTWADTTTPYVRTVELFRSPCLPSPDRSAFGYAFERTCGGRAIGSLPDPDKQRLLFDSNDLSWNANGGLALLSSDMSRHHGRATVCFSSGICRRTSRKQIFDEFRRSRGAP